MVIYYSGTGNSRYIAELLAVRLGDELVCANDYIKAEKRGEFCSEKPYVFVFPTYAWRVPRVFEDFYTQGAFTGNTKAYFVMTCGDSIGSAGYFLEKLCQMQLMSYMGVYEVRMPENYVARFRVPSKEEQEKIIAAAERKIPIISKYIREQEDFPKPDGKQAAAFTTQVITPVFYLFGVKDKGFRSTDRCTGCGECVRLCPLNNITLKEGRPAYRGNCTHCMACISGCPAEAIEYKRRTVGKPRYYLRKTALPQ